MRWLILAGGLAACAHAPASHWETIAGVHYGVVLAGSRFEVDVIDDRDDNGSATPPSLFAIGERGAPSVSAQMPAIASHGAPIARAPELVAADHAFAADSAARGADAWASWFARDGSRWTNGARIVGPAIAADIAKTLARGQLAWTPLADGKLDAIGYTLGTWTFTGAHGTATGSYCTIWRRQPDGSWKVALDLGRPAH